MRKPGKATIGVITALPEEYAAVCEVLGCKEQIDAPGHGSGRKYAVGTLNTKAGASHTIAVAFSVDMGNNSAAIRATQMVQHYPSIKQIIMVGIAGAVPNPDKVTEHVRLGDIVVSDRKGVIQYDFNKENSKFTENRHAPRPPSATLIEAVKFLAAEELRKIRPWETYIQNAVAKLGSEWERPSEDTDTLQDEPVPAPPVPHPTDVERRSGQPKVFHGPIASANNLLKNPTRRNALRDQFGVKAVEMEGSGVADAAWSSDNGYLVIRATCDYCNPAKGDAWHNYAAVVAAAYARSVIETTPPLTPTKKAANQVKRTFSRKVSALQPEQIRRERDVEQLQHVFYWLNLDVLNHFIERLCHSCLTTVGTDFFECFSQVVKSPKFHINDPELRLKVETFFRAWEESFCDAYSMDLRPNGNEAYFILAAGDIPRYPEQMAEMRRTREKAAPLRVALDSLLGCVRANYLEIDPTKCGHEALKEYRLEQDRVKKLFTK